MKTLKGLLRALVPRTAGREADVGESVRVAIQELGRDIGALRTALAGVTTELGVVQVQIEQLVALRLDERDAPARMDVLERVLDADRTAAHMSQALARTAIVEDPVPHAITSDLMPPDVYEAVIAAIPRPVFFEDSRTGGRELRVPPALAPICSIATWTFLTDLVARVLAPALVEQFQRPLDRHLAALFPPLDRATRTDFVLAGPGRVVRRSPGVDAPAPRMRPWHFLTTILFLARPGDGEDHGSRLHGGAVEVPFLANSALTVLGPAEAHEYTSIPCTAPSHVRRYSYEFRVDLRPEVRRRLMRL